LIGPHECIRRQNRSDCNNFSNIPRADSGDSGQIRKILCPEIAKIPVSDNAVSQALSGSRG
jgi:hypothetical protein